MYSPVSLLGMSGAKVGLKGEEPILAGDLAANVQPDDCMWNLADSKMLEITLAKSDAMRWWPHVLKGEPELNLQKVHHQMTASCVDSCRCPPGTECDTRQHTTRVWNQLNMIPS